MGLNRGEERMKKNKIRILSFLLVISMVMAMNLSSSFAATSVSTTSSSVKTPTGSSIKTPTSSSIKTPTGSSIKTPTSSSINTTTGSSVKTSTSSSINTTTSAKDDGYTDIKGHWAEAKIKEAASLKLVGGYPGGKFWPDNQIKREEFFKLLVNVLTVTPDVSKTEIKFSDVVPDEWYVPTIKIAVAGNITKGYEDGTFGIGRPMSRQEAAKVVASVIPTFDLPADGNSASTIKDKALIGQWAYDYVDIMFKKGYMKGDTEGNFRPAAALTRAEATVILLNIKKNEPIIAANANDLAMTGCLKSHKGDAGAFKKGEGTKEKPYEISTEDQLDHLRIHTSEAAFYVLTNDIKITKDFATTIPKIGSDDPNWSGGNFSPIGTKSNPFKGHLDGGGFTISGLNITGLAGGSLGSGQKEKGLASNVALFGFVGEGASVTSLILDNATIKGGQYTGGFASYNQGTIRDCLLDKNANVTGNTYTGGIVGYSEKPLTKNTNKGTVTGTGTHTGGIAGCVNAPGMAVSDCTNRGTVNGCERTGGIAGSVSFVLDDAPMIKKCSNLGTVNGSSYQAGGIVGILDGSSGKITAENCYNEGTVTGTGIIGGVVGVVKSDNITITQCYNDGTVRGGSAGGVVGTNEGTIQYCYNKGTVEGNNEAGGITAFQNEKAIVTRSYNEGSVTATSFAGGIVGTNRAKINNSYNAGDLKGTNAIGGIAGKNEGAIENVYGAGKITASNGAGSLIGRNAGILKNSFWLEDTASNEVGMSDGSFAPISVKKVTVQELSGQIKFKTANGYEMAIDIMNKNNATINNPNPSDVWKYIYKMTSEATKGTTTVISDGGGIVKPLEQYSSDETGNTIAPSDLKGVYLYPCLIDL